MTIVVNFFAEPGAGKTTMMAAVFTELKFLGINCEMATEYAKDLVWEDRSHAIANQLYISAKQFHRINRLNGKVDVIITDSPILLGIIYNKNPSTSFNEVLIEHFNRFENMNFLVERSGGEYKKEGRLQTEKESVEIRFEVAKLLHDYTDGCLCVDRSKKSVSVVVAKVLDKLGRKIDGNGYENKKSKA